MTSNFERIVKLTAEMDKYRTRIDELEHTICTIHPMTSEAKMKELDLQRWGARMGLTMAQLEMLNLVKQLKEGKP
jgi:hypothetical protein